MGLRDKIQDAKTQPLVINRSIKQFRLTQMQKHKYKYENTSLYVVLTCTCLDPFNTIFITVR